MKYFYLLLISCLMSSCEFFQMEKRTASDVILEEELHRINWHEVDTYPVFYDCKAKKASKQLECFIEVLHNNILHGMQRYAETNELDSSMELDILITIEADKKLSFSADMKAMGINSAARLQLLKEYIQEGLDSLEVVEPAFKRGIPVTTEFALPVIFSQENE